MGQNCCIGLILAGKAWKCSVRGAVAMLITTASLPPNFQNPAGLHRPDNMVLLAGSGLQAKGGAPLL